MKILALDKGNRKSVYVLWFTGQREQCSDRIDTNVHSQKVLTARSPDRLVIEAGPAADWSAIWLKDEHQVLVVNCNDQRWHWKNVKEILNDPHRFKWGRQVACYMGLTPRRWQQNGNSDRQRHISRAGTGPI